MNENLHRDMNEKETEWLEEEAGHYCRKLGAAITIPKWMTIQRAEFLLRKFGLL
jgi:hypothetical protein